MPFSKWFVASSSLNPEHSVRCRVVISSDAGWDVYREIDGRLMSITHCSDWHRVERICERLEHQIAPSQDAIENPPLIFPNAQPQDAR